MIYQLILSIAIIFLTLLIKRSRRKYKVPLPPGPKGLPIVGNLPFLEPELHHYFAKLSKTYGPIFKVQLGRKLCVVISSPSLAKEILKDHDTIFANRDIPAVGFSGSYGGIDIVWSPYGDNWRMLRKVCVRELFSNGKLEVLYGLRRREVRDMVNQTYAKVGQPIGIREHILVTMFHIITSMMWGGTLEEQERKRVNLEFQEVAEEIFIILGKLNVSDLFPVTAMFDIQGLERKMKKLILWLDRIFDFVIAQRLKMDSEGKANNDLQKKDFLQVLLEFKNQERSHETPFTTNHIKAMFLDLVMAGTKTTSITIEWVMAELITHPEQMRKVQEELEEVVGWNNTVEESHSPKLKYLNAVVKETLRLHPVAPLLLPRSPSESCVVGGYMIPKGAKVLVNAWVMQRDPEVWENQLDFRPERFLDSDVECDFKGTNFSYLPFGSGRRVCVGLPLAERTMAYLIASLLHSFNWNLPEGAELDLSETFGFELKKITPLVIIPTPRSLDSSAYVPGLDI